MALMTGQITIYDLNDIIIQPTEPSPKQEGMVWLDTSGEPPYQLKTYKGGKWERTYYDSLAELDPEQYTIIQNSYQHIKDLDTDNKLTRYERSVVRNELATIIGKHLLSTESMPTLEDIDSNGIGELFEARAEAIEVGIPSTDVNYTRLGTAYNALSTYLAYLTPKAWDIDSEGVAEIDSAEWDGKWNEFYVALSNLRVMTAAKREENTEAIKKDVATVNETITTINKRVSEAEAKLNPDSITLSVTTSEEFNKIINTVADNAENYVNQYAEKKRHTGPTAPDDTSVIWVDNSNPNNVVWKVYDPTQEKWVLGPINEGKNLFIESRTVSGFYDDSGSLTGGDTYKTSDYIEVTPNEPYFLSKYSTEGYIRIAKFDSNKNFIGREVTPNTFCFYTPTSSVSYIRVSVERTLNRISVLKSNIQVDWTPAPEDVEKAIEEYTQNLTDQINNLSETTSAKIQITDKKITDTISRVTDMEGEITSKLAEFERSLDNFEFSFTELDGRLGSGEEGLREVRSYFNFGKDEANKPVLTIGQTSSPLKIKITNEEIQFIDNGVVVARINGQVMTIDSLVALTSLIVGNHKIEKFNNDITVIRWAGAN